MPRPSLPIMIIAFFGLLLFGILLIVGFMAYWFFEANGQLSLIVWLGLIPQLIGVGWYIRYRLLYWDPRRWEWRNGREMDSPESYARAFSYAPFGLLIPIIGRILFGEEVLGMLIAPFMLGLAAFSLFSATEGARMIWHELKNRAR